MSQTDREKRICIMRAQGSFLLPVSLADAEIIEGLGPGDVEVRFAKRRSNPQLRLYWQMLTFTLEAGRAGDDYPNSERLHEAIKMHLGYTTPVKTFDGETVHIADSVAFAKMDGFEFKEFFDRAARLLANTYFIDPLEFYVEPKRISKKRQARSP